MDAKLTCGICRKKFQEVEDFMLHKKMLPDLHTCHRCGVFFHHKDELRRHNESHDQNTPDANQLAGNEDDNYVNSSDSEPENQENDYCDDGFGDGRIRQIFSNLDDTGQIMVRRDSEESERDNNSTYFSPDENSRIEASQQDDSTSNAANTARTSGDFACPMCSHVALSEAAVFRHLFTEHGMVVADEDRLLTPGATPSIGTETNAQHDSTSAQSNFNATQDTNETEYQFVVSGQTSAGKTASRSIAPSETPKRGRGRPSKMMRLT